MPTSATIMSHSKGAVYTFVFMEANGRYVVRSVEYCGTNQRSYVCDTVFSNLQAATRCYEGLIR
jgi:hypothetical protein